MTRYGKKLLTLFCLLALVCSLGCLHAFAIDPDVNEQSQDENVPPPAEQQEQQEQTPAGEEPVVPYTYTVRIYAGKRGVFDTTKIAPGSNVTVTSDCITVTGLQDKEDALDCLGLTPAEAGEPAVDGDEPVTDDEDVTGISNAVVLLEETSDDGRTTTPSRYYVQGFRLGGRDNNATGDEGVRSTIEQQAQANGDTDYVVAYGIAGELVKYRVNYVSIDGIELHKPDVYEGNVGEKPVISYRYVEGYLPNAYKLTKTLSQKESENVFTFYYYPVGGTIYQQETVTDYGTTETVIPGGVIGAPGGAAGGGAGGAGGAGGGGAAGGGAGGGAGAGGGDAGADAGGGGGADQGVDIQGEQVPQGIIDLDDNQTPMGNLELDEDTTNRIGLFGAVAGAMAAVAGLGWLAWFLLAGRKRRKDEEKA